MSTFSITCTVVGTAGNYSLDLTETGTSNSAETITVENLEYIQWQIVGPAGSTTEITGIVQTGDSNIFDGTNGSVPAPLNGDKSLWQAEVESTTVIEDEIYCIHFTVDGVPFNQDPRIDVQPQP